MVLVKGEPGVNNFCVAIKVPRDSKGYDKLARLVSARNALRCPRCGGEMVLCLKPDTQARGIQFHGSFVCVHCDCGSCVLNEN